MSYIVTYRGHPVKFTKNLQRVWSLCHIDDATTFESVGDAMVKLVDWNLRGNDQFQVEERLRRSHWWCGTCNWHGQSEDSIAADAAGELCCPECGNTDVREKGSPLFKVP